MTTRLLSLLPLLLLLGCAGCFGLGGVPYYKDANGIAIPRKGLGDGLPPQENLEDRRLLDPESLYVYKSQENYYRGFDRFWPDGRMASRCPHLSMARLRPEELTAAHGDDMKAPPRMPAAVGVGRYTIVGRDIYIEYLSYRYPSGLKFYLQKGRILEDGDIRWTHSKWRGARRWAKWSGDDPDLSAVAKKVKVGKMNFVPTW